MNNKFYDQNILITFSSTEEMEAYAKRQKSSNLQIVERTPEMEAYIKKGIQHLYSISDEEERVEYDNLLKDFKWLYDSDINDEDDFLLH